MFETEAVCNTKQHIKSMFSLKRRGIGGQSKSAPLSQSLHAECSLKRTAANFIRGAPGRQCSAPAAKKANLRTPLRFEVVCTFPSEFHRGFALCYLAHASHPAESKCSQSKVRWRQRQAGERQGKGRAGGQKVL